MILWLAGSKYVTPFCAVVCGTNFVAALGPIKVLRLQLPRLDPYFGQNDGVAWPLRTPFTLV